MTNPNELEARFRPKTEPAWNVLNLGAGVQSSCLALMAARGEFDPQLDFCVFSDTQAEPAGVYDWLPWLEKELPFPVYRVTSGNLEADSLTPRKATQKAKLYEEGEEYMRRLIPLFGEAPDGKKTAALGRICTADYKIVPIEREIKKRC